MADPFAKMIPGRKVASLPAAAWNAFLDAERAVRQSGMLQARRSAPAGSSEEVVQLRNDSGVEVAIGEILGMGDPVYSFSTDVDEQNEFRRNPRQFAGVFPDADLHAHRWAIALEPIAQGAFGACAVSGIYPCRVEVAAEDHEQAILTTGDATKLTSAESGIADILWKEPGTGTKWALVYVRPFGASGGGGGATIDIVQATADGANGTVAVKALTLKADVSASPNFTQAATGSTVNYLKL